MNKRERLWLLAILVAAALLRLGSALYQGDRIEFLPGIHDQVSYDMLAKSLLQGDGYVFARPWWPKTAPWQPTAFWSFLYPLYLAGVYLLFGPHPLPARILQAIVVGPLTAWLLYRLGRRVFNPTVGLFAAGISALYVYYIYYHAALMTEPFYIAAILGALDLAMEIVERPTWRKWLALGLLLGIATLLRQVILLFLPFLLGWMLWAGRGRFRWWKVLLPLIPLLLLILPWTIRNYLVFDHFVLLNTNAGFAFFWANHPEHGTHFQPLLVAEIPQELYGMSEAEMNDALLARGLGFILEDPGRYLLLCLSRIPVYFKFWPSPESSLLSNISRTLSFGLFLPFMLYGLYLSGKRSTLNINRLVLLYLFILVYSGIHLLSWALIRYRLPVDAVLIPFAGLGLSDLYARFFGRKKTALGQTP